jgi:phosphate transport system permease protein
MIWLTGGALLTALAMIAGLIGMIVYQGASTFWPAPILAIKLADQRVFLGEAIDSDLDPKAGWRWKFRGSDAANGSRLDQWIWESQIVDETRSAEALPKIFPPALIPRAPEWAVTVDRWQDARVYGVLTGFVEAGQTVTEDPAEADTLFRQVNLRAAQREHRRLSAEITALNQQAATAVDKVATALKLLPLESWNSQDEAATMRLAELRSALNKSKSASAEIVQEIVTLLPAETASMLPATALKQFTPTAQEERRLALKTRQARKVELESKGVRLMLFSRAPQGEPLEIPLIGIVQMTAPNRIGWWEKVSVYASRWWEFISEDPRESNLEGGVFPCIWGTVALTLIMSLIVSPFGVLAALYLREYASAGPLVSMIRIAINNLAGVPSIVFGAFGLVFFCTWIGGTLDQLVFTPEQLSTGAVWGKGGLLWASLTMALLTLPVVIVATEEALAAVPNSMREGSYACGASKWQTIRRIVLPRALPGILTGLILAMARGAGEVAPLMLVGVMQTAPELPVDTNPPFVHLERGFMHLSYHIYSVGFLSPNSAAARPLVMTAALLLITIVGFLNLLAVYLRNRLRRRYAGNQF